LPRGHPRPLIPAPSPYSYFKVALHFNTKLKECQMEPSPNDTLHSHITQELKTTTVTPTHYKASEVSLCLPYVHLGNVSKAYVTVYGGVVEADVEADRSRTADGCWSISRCCCRNGEQTRTQKHPTDTFGSRSSPLYLCTQGEAEGSRCLG
jgi:hypothetical protein